jgi:uncharacterized protein DUF6602
MYRISATGAQSTANFLLRAMNTSQYFQSLSQEMRALQNRVRNFIDDAHWLTDGEWKESVLRNFLRPNLPRSVEVGRGFVVSAKGNSNQIDVLIYDSAKPVLFRDGDLVFVTPDAVCGAIEVKSNLNNTSFAQTVAKLTRNISFISSQGRAGKRFAIFSFESSVTTPAALDILKSASKGARCDVIDLVCLGDSHFIRWRYYTAEKPTVILEAWRSYRLRQMAPGYFLHDFVEFVDHECVNKNAELWFPRDGKENDKDGEISLKDVQV